MEQYLDTLTSCVCLKDAESWWTEPAMCHLPIHIGTKEQEGFGRFLVDNKTTPTRETKTQARYLQMHFVFSLCNSLQVKSVH